MVADREANFQEQLTNWEGMFRRHKIRDWTRQWVEQQFKVVEIHWEGKRLNQRDSFVHQGGAICKERKSVTEIHRRIIVGAKAWR